MDHLQSVVSQNDKANATDGVILWLVSVAISADKNLHSAGDATVLPEFFGGAGDVDGDGRQQVIHGCDRLSE